MLIYCCWGLIVVALQIGFSCGQANSVVVVIFVDVPVLVLVIILNLLLWAKCVQSHFRVKANNS